MRYCLYVVLILLGLYLFTGVKQVSPGERAVVRRFGRVLDYKPVPGLWIGLPWGMDRVDSIPIDFVRPVPVGLRSTELRFDGFTFGDEQTKARWGELSQMEFQVLVPHRPGHLSLADKNKEIRRRHRLGPEVTIVFLEVQKGDPSDFHMTPLMQIERESDMEVIRLSRCASVSHVLAAIALEFSKVGHPPEIYFGWSYESPLATNLNFLFLGEGNIPWMVHELMRHLEPNVERRPRVVIG